MEAEGKMPKSRQLEAINNFKFKVLDYFESQTCYISPEQLFTFSKKIKISCLL